MSQCSQPARGPHHEHAAVPVVAPFVEITLRRRQIRLFDKRLNTAGAVGSRITHTDVAKPRFRAIRRDSQDHDVAFCRATDRCLQGCCVSCLVDDRLISWCHHQNRVAAANHRLQGSQRNGRSGVAPYGLQQQ